MRKTHEVLRLHFDLKLKQRQIARGANLSQSTVDEYLRRFGAAGLSWPLPEQMSEAELESALFSADAKPPRAPAHYLPNFSHIHEELQKHKHVTLLGGAAAGRLRVLVSGAAVCGATTLRDCC